MKKLFLLLFTAVGCWLNVGNGCAQITKPSLHVEGRQLVDDKGHVVLLHGVMDTPNVYFNGRRWGDYWGYPDEAVEPCIAYFDKLYTALTDNSQGAYCDVFRLHLDPCWTNDPTKPRIPLSEGNDGSEANISQFSEARLQKFFSSLYIKLIEKALAHGLYVVVRPPGVCPPTIQVGGEYQQYLLKVWDIVSKNVDMQRYAGRVSIELANEPVKLVDANGKETARACHDFFQPIVDKIRANGFDGIIWVPGTGWQANYRSYASYPITGHNIGYAVHAYVGWYGNEDKNANGETFIRQFGESVPVVKTNPVIITEVDWSPKNEGSGHYNEHGEWVVANYGTWATGTTSHWGNAYKAMMDYYGNISMTLSGTGCYLDIDKYLNNGIVAPAFVADMQANGLDPNEACSKACFDWYKDYAQANIDHQQPFTRDDSVVVSISAEKPSFTIMPNGSLPINIVATYRSGRKADVAWKCDYAVDNNGVVTIADSWLHANGNGKVKITATYKDEKGNEAETSFEVDVTMFPLTTESFDPRIWESGTFDEATHTLITGQWGFGGWRYSNPLDLSGYRYLIVKLKKKSTAHPSFRLFDENSYWTGACENDMTDKTEIAIDLHNMKKTKDGQTLTCDPSHIYIAGFWSFGGSPIEIEGVYVSDDGHTASAIADVIAKQHAGDGFIYDLSGRRVSADKSSLKKGIYIRNGHKFIIK